MGSFSSFNHYNIIKLLSSKQTRMNPQRLFAFVLFLGLFFVFGLLGMEDREWVLVRPVREKDLWSPSGGVGDGGESSKPLVVRFGGPAKHWTDAVPIGNGRLGAMVWGGVASETINLNGMLKFLFFGVHFGV